MARLFHGSMACWLDCLTARRLDGGLRLDLFFGDSHAAAPSDEPIFPIPPPVSPLRRSGCDVPLGRTNLLGGLMTPARVRTNFVPSGLHCRLVGQLFYSRLRRTPCCTAQTSLLGPDNLRVDFPFVRARGAHDLLLNIGWFTDASGQKNDVLAGSFASKNTKGNWGQYGLYGTLPEAFLVSHNYRIRRK
jgi:hypothetical protein